MKNRNRVIAGVMAACMTMGMAAVPVMADEQKNYEFTFVVLLLDWNIGTWLLLESKQQMKNLEQQLRL